MGDDYSSMTMKARQYTIVILSATTIVAGFIFMWFVHVRDEREREPSRQIVGVIVPHHALADRYIREVFEHVVRDGAPTKIILIGPNHAERGPSMIAVGRHAIRTIAGDVSVDTNVVDDIQSHPHVLVEDTLIKEEHSITTLLPYVKEYVPNATVVPVIFRYAYPAADAARFGAYLASHLDESTLLIASIDFSHYLPSDVSDGKDEYTKQLIDASAYQEIGGLSNDYLDSPATLNVFLSAMNTYAPHVIEPVAHGNSADIIGEPLQSSTSYMTYIVRRVLP